MTLKKDHEEREKIVFAYLNKIVSDTNIIFYQEKNIFVIPLRIQLIISFSLLDALASYYFEYTGTSTAIQKVRFKEWVKKYCLVKKNSEYEINEFWSRVDEHCLYQLRSSLVHFFGVNAKCGEVYVSIANNNINDKAIHEKEFELSGMGADTVLIRPHDLHKIIKKGGILMLNEWHDILSKSSSDISLSNPHIQGIKRLMDKINVDGAFPSN